MDGKPYDAEIQFEHSNEEGQLLHIGVFFDVEEGDAGNNWLIEDFSFDSLEEAAGQDEYIASVLDIKTFLDALKNKEFYHYLGSLTTPDCDETVEWIVYKSPVFISKRNFDILENHLGVSN